MVTSRSLLNIRTYSAVWLGVTRPDSYEMGVLEGSSISVPGTGCEMGSVGAETGRASPSLPTSHYLFSELFHSAQQRVLMST